MKYCSTLFFSFFSLSLSAQNIEYRNDSLFVNSFFVDAFTSKLILDSLLKSTGKTDISKDKDKRNSVTGKKVKETTYFYHDLGLFFRKYDDDTTKLSVGIKLYPHKLSKPEAMYGMRGKQFRGQLIIAENLINDKRQISELQNLKNCSITLTELNFGSYNTIIGGDIIYKENIIRLAFDSQTKELTEVFIHHNFKDR